MKKRICTVLLGLITIANVVGMSACGNKELTLPEKLDYSNSTKQLDMFAFYGPDEGRFHDGSPMGEGTDFRTKERYQEYKDCGFNILLLENEAPYRGEAWDTSDVKMIMDICHEIGLKVMVYDTRIWKMGTAGDLIGKTVDGNTFRSQADVNSVIADYMKDYSKHPAYYGVYIMDEPQGSQIDSLFQCYIGVKAYTPDAYVHCCFIGDDSISDKTWEYMTENSLDVIGMDTYPWQFNRADGKKIILSTYLYHIQELATKCSQNDVDFSATTLACFGNNDSAAYPNGYTVGWRIPTDEELQWSMSTTLAFAPKKMGWYYYWEDSYAAIGQGAGIMSGTGEKLRYDKVQQLNLEAHKYMKAMANFEFKGAHYYTETRRLPYYYLVDNSYQIPNITCTDMENETLITHLVDEERGNTGYFLTNTTDPQDKETSKVTVAFKDCNAMVLYKDGEPSLVPLNDGKYTFTLGTAECCFVLPYKN